MGAPAGCEQALEIADTVENPEPATAERNIASPYKPPLRRIYSIQLLLLLILSAALAAWDWVVAYSALCGGAIAVSANAWFARQVFRYQGARNAPLITRSFYRGEMGKLLLAAVMFALVFALIRPLSPAALFGGFIAFTLINSVLIAAATGDRRHNRRGN